MQPKRPSWEATILAFGIIFTLSLGLTNVMVAALNRGAVPWFFILIVSLAVVVLLRYLPRRSKQ